MAENFVLDAPGLQKLVGQLGALMRQDASLRDLRGRNATLARHFDQPGVFSAVGSVTVTGNVQYRIAEAQSNQGETFSSLVLVFESGSGSGRWRSDGALATTAIGVQVPAGGVVLTIPGHENIRNFSLMAEALQTLVFSRYLFV